MRPHFELIGFACLLSVLTAWSRSSLLAASADSPEAEPLGNDALPQTEAIVDVTDLDLDDLLKVQVTSPGKKEQALADVPAAVYVIREDDLKRSGATSIAEALRQTGACHACCV